MKPFNRRKGSYTSSRVSFSSETEAEGTLSASVSEEKDTLEDVYEPFLLLKGFIHRTPRGRVATEQAYQHLQIPLAHTESQMHLF